jgi:SAM-dependent methyltransferase
MGLESNLGRLYSTRFDETERSRKAALWRALCGSFFARYVPSSATVVDVGSGYCEFINAIRAARRIAIDLNPDAMKFADPGVEVYCSAIGDLPKLLGPQSVDVAFASNVFEHLRSPEALLEALAAIRGVLRRDGRLLIMQPNIRHVAGRFWDFVDHTLPLTEIGMAEALALSGFRVVELRSRFLPYTTKSRLPQWPWLVKLYVRLRPAQFFFGKQMFIVAQPAGE